MGKKLFENQRIKRRSQASNNNSLTPLVSTGELNNILEQGLKAREGILSQKNYRRKQKTATIVKPGRPFNDQLAMLKFTEIDHIKNCFLQYLDNVGYKRGLVFMTKERQMLIQQQKQNGKTETTLPEIKWDLQHRWEQSQQLQKITKILKQQNIPIQLQYPKLHEHLLSISDIFPRQVTQQIYRFMLTIYAHVITKSQHIQSEIIDKIVEHIIHNRYEKYYFVTGCFSWKFKSSLRIQDIRCQIVKLVDKVSKYVGFLVKK